MIEENIEICEDTNSIVTFTLKSSKNDSDSKQRLLRVSKNGQQNSTQHLIIYKTCNKTNNSNNQRKYYAVRNFFENIWKRLTINSLGN